MSVTPPPLFRHPVSRDLFLLVSGKSLSSAGSSPVRYRRGCSVKDLTQGPKDDTLKRIDTPDGARSTAKVVASARDLGDFVKALSTLLVMAKAGLEGQKGSHLRQTWLIKKKNLRRFSPVDQG